MAMYTAMKEYLRDYLDNNNGKTFSQGWLLD